MKRSHIPLWTLDELGTRVAMAASVDPQTQAERIVEEVRNLNTIRSYTTLGLLDVPARVRGLRALYSERHLLQLVAIKRLQARGMPLEDIHQRVARRSDSALRLLVNMPPGIPGQPQLESGEPELKPEPQNHTDFEENAPEAAPERPATPQRRKNAKRIVARAYPLWPACGWPTE